MTHMIIGEVESIDMNVEERGSSVSMEPSSITEEVTMSSPTPVVSRIERNYDKLNNRPSINEHLLIGGENSLSDLGIGRAKNTDVNRLFS